MELDPAHKRAAEGGKFRQRRNGAKFSFLNTGQLGLAYLWYIEAGEIAGARNNSGCPIHLLELLVAQNLETASRESRGIR